MTLAETLYHCGAASLLVLGVVHNLIEVAQGMREQPAELAGLIERMKGTEIVTPGRPMTVFGAMRGFSLTMGLGMIAVGALNHAIAPIGVESPTILGINIAFCAAGLALSVRYFFVVPIAVLVLALGFFVGAALL